jgi:HPt (histidine-containing phosphotransfer) domain-containing protein
MNDHVGKPFDIHYLVEVLRRHTGRMTEQELRQIRAQLPLSPLGEETMQMEAALRDMGDDQQLYTEVLGAYQQELLLLPDQLASFLQAGDRSAAQRLVHTLKGTSATVGAKAFAAQALLLEQEIKDPASNLLALGRLQPFLDALQRTQGQLAPIYAALSATP